MITIKITKAEKELLLKPVKKPWGGHQYLLIDLQNGIRGDRVEMTRETAERIIVYPVKYVKECGKSGGWQQRILPLVDRVKAALPPDNSQTSLFD